MSREPVPDMSAAHDDRLPFRGTETLLLDVPATVSRAWAEEQVRALGPIDLVGGTDRIEASVCALYIRGLRVGALPLLRFSYPEVLWRISARVDGAPAWIVLRCDVGRVMRPLVSLSDRYHARASEIRFDERRLSVHAPAGALVLRVEHAEGPGAWPGERSVLTVDARGSLHRIPWGHAVPAETQGARVFVEDARLLEATFHPGATLATEGTLARRREHACGIARPARSGSK